MRMTAPTVSIVLRTDAIIIIIIIIIIIVIIIIAALKVTTPIYE